MFFRRMDHLCPKFQSKTKASKHQSRSRFPLGFLLNHSTKVVRIILSAVSGEKGCDLVSYVSIRLMPVMLPIIELSSLRMTNCKIGIKRNISQLQLAFVSEWNVILKKTPFDIFPILDANQSPVRIRIDLILQFCNFVSKVIVCC